MTRRRIIVRTARLLHVALFSFGMPSVLLLRHATCSSTCGSSRFGFWQSLFQSARSKRRRWQHGVRHTSREEYEDERLRSQSAKPRRGARRQRRDTAFAASRSKSADAIVGVRSSLCVHCCCAHGSPTSILTALTWLLSISRQHANCS